LNLNRGGNDYESLPGLVSDLVSRAPAVIFATGSVSSVFWVNKFHM
jgi:hypothetical protein